MAQRRPSHSNSSRARSASGAPTTANAPTRSTSTTTGERSDRAHPDRNRSGGPRAATMDRTGSGRTEDRSDAGRRRRRGPRPTGESGNQRIERSASATATAVVLGDDRVNDHGPAGHARPPMGRNGARVPAPPAEDAVTFADLGAPRAAVDVLAAQGITHAFPIQQATMIDALAGRDLLGRGKTGSGKTIAFVLPMLTRLAASPQRTRPGHPRGLILVPTRELANQVHATMAPLAQALGLSSTTIFGGVGPSPQIAALRRGVDVVVACPGRLEDHIQGRHARLDSVEITVLDEADHMCDLGFLPAVVRILGKTPAGGQRMMFSATLDRAVDSIVQRFMHDPATHSVDGVEDAPVEMEHHVFHVDGAQRLPVLIELAGRSSRTVMFTRTKYRAKTLARQLNANGVRAVEMHGNLAQGARERNLADFSSGRATTLVATDIAARGIHVDDVELVIHADPPVEHKAYLHRSGRTARAGNSGTVITIMTDEQVNDVRQLTRKAGITATTTRVNRTHPLIAELT